MDKIIVIGCPRSGTKSMSDILRLIGFDVGHEKMGVDGISDWKWNDFYEIRATYIHVIRKPVAWYRSMHTIGEASKNILRRRMDIQGTMGEIYLRYYIMWNERCSNVTTRRVRTESLPVWSNKRSAPQRIEDPNPDLLEAARKLWRDLT